MFPRFIAILLLSACPTLASDWWTYDNSRFGYAIELPPEFHVAISASNGDGLTLVPSDNSAKLLVYGTSALDGDFATETRIRVALAKTDGWQISYSKMNSRGASFSGVRRDRIVYVRGVALCKGGAAFLQMDYPKADMQRYDAIVMRLVRSLKATEKCAASARGEKWFPSTG